VATIDGTLDLSVNTNGNNTYTATNSTTTVNGTIINGGTVNATALNLIFAANAQYEHVRNGGVVPAATRDATSVTRITGITTTNPTGLTGTFGHFVWNNTGQTTATGLLNGALNVNGRMEVAAGTLHDNGQLVTGNATVGNFFRVAANATYTTTRIATPWLPSNYTDIQLHATSTVNYNGTTGHLIVQNPNGTAVTTAYGHLSFAGAVTKTVSGGDISANNLTISAGILADGGNTISVVGNLSSNGTHSGAGRILMQGTAPQLITTTVAATRPFGNIEVDNAAGVSLGGINQTFIYRIDGTLTLTDGSFNVENATLQFNGQPLAGTPALLSTTTLSNLTYTGAVAGHVVPASVADLRQLILNNASGLALSGDLNINLNLAGALTLTSGRLRLGAHDLTMVGSITTAITGGGINNMVVADGAGQLRRTMVTGSYVFPVGDESGGITVVGNPGADYSPVTLNFTANSTPRIIGVRVTDDKHPDDVTANDYISRYWSFTDSQAGVGTYTYTGTFTYSTLAPSDLVGTHATARLNSWDQNASFWTQYTTTGLAPTLTVTGATETSGPLADNDFTARVNSATVYTWLPTSGSNSWTVASNWDPQRVSPQPTDILQFTEGGNPTVTNVPIQTIGTLLVGDDGGNGPTDVTFTSTVSSTLTINNTTGTTFNIEAGSALRLSSAGTIGTLIAFTGTNVATIDGTLDLSVNTNGNNTYTATNSTTTVNGTIINGGTVNATALNLIFAANAQYEHVRNGGVVPAATRDATSVTRITGITTTNPTGLTGTFGHFVWNNTGQTTATGLLNGALNVNGRMEVAAGTLHDNGQLVTGNATVGNFFRVAANATYTTTRIATPWLPSNYTDIQLHATSTVNYNGTTGHLIVQNPNGTAVTTAYGHLSFAGAVTKTVSGGDISANNLTISAGILADGGNTISVVGNLSSNGTHSGAGRILMQGTAPQLITTTVAATRPFGNIEVDNAAGVSLGGINQTFIYRIDGTLTLTDGSFNVENATLQFNGQPLAGTPGLLTTTTLSNLSYTGAVAGHVVPASVADLRQLILNNASGLALSGDLNINLNLAGALTLTSGRLRLGAHDLTMVGSITTAITGGGINNMVVADGAGQLRRTMVTGSYVFPVGDESGGITVVGNPGADYSPVTLNFTANSTPRIIGVRVTDDKHPDDATANDYISRYWSFTDSQAGVGTYTYTGTFTYSTLAPSDLVGTHATARLNSWDQNASFWTQYTTTGLAPTLTVTGATETSGPLADNDFTARVNSATVYTWLPTSGSNSWTVASNWDPQRVSPQPTDILQFTEGGNPTVTNVPIQTIGTLLVGDDGGNGPTDVTFTSTVSSTLTISNTTGTTFEIEAGSALRLSSAGTIGTLIAFTGTNVATIDGTLDLSVNTNGNNTYTATNSTTTVNGTIINGGTVNATALNLIFAANAQYEHVRNGGVVPAATRDATSVTRITGITTTNPTGLTGTFGHFVWNNTGQTTATGLLNGALNVNGRMEVAAGTLHDNGQLVTGNATVGNFFRVAANATYTTTRIATPWLPSNYTDIQLHATSTVNYNGTTGHLIVQNPNGTAVTTAYGHLSFAGAVTKTVSGGDISANNLTISAGILADGGNTISVVGNLSSNGTHSGAGRILMQGTAPQLITTTVAATRPFGNIEVDNAAGVSLGGINQTFIYRIDGTLTLTDGSFNVENATLQFNGQPLAGTPGLLTTTTLSNLSYTGAVAGHVVPASVADLRQLILNNASGLALSGDLNINLNLAGALTLTSGRLRLGAHDLTMVGSITTAITGGGINNMVVADGAGQLRRTMVTGSYVFPVGDESGGITVVGNPGADYSPVTLNFTANSTPRIIGVRVTDDKHPDDATANDYISRYWSFTDSQAGVGTYTYTGTFTYSTLAPSDLVGTHATARLNSWDQNASFWTQYTTTGLAPTLTVTGATETSGPLADNDFTARVNSATVYTWLPTSGSNSWTVASNWDPQRVSPQPTDILQFTEGGNPTVTNVPIQTIGTLLVGDDGGNGPTDVTFTSTVSSTLTINNTTGTTFNIEAGSALRLSSAGTIGTLIAFTGTNVATIDGTLDLSVNTNGNNTYTATNSTTTVNGTIINGGTVNATALNLIFAANAQYEHVRNGGVVPAATRDATSVTRITGITTTNPTGLTGTFGHFVWNNTGQTTATGLLNGALNVNGRMEVAAGTLHDNGQLVTGNATVGNFFRVAANATYTTTRIATPWLPSNYTDIQLHATSTVNYNGTTGHLIVQNPNGTAVTTAYGHLSFAGAVTKTVSGGDISANNLTISAGILADGGNTISVVGNLSSNGTHSGAGRILMQGTAPQLITTTVAATRPFGNIEVDNAAGVSLGGINQTFIYRIDGTLTLTDGSFNVENATLQFNGQPLAGTPGLLTTTTLSNLSYTGAVAGHVVPASVADLRQLILNNASGLALSGDLNINLNLAGALTLTSGRLRLGAHDLTMVGSITTAITGGGINNMVVADGAGQLRRTMVTGSYVFPVGDESGGITVVGNPGADYSPVTLNFTANSTPRIIGVRVTDDKHPDDATANDYISRYWSFTDSQAGVGTYTYTGTFTYSTLAPSDLVGTHATARLNSWDQNASFWTQYTTTGAAPTLTVTGATETSGPLADNDFTARVNSATVYTWLPTSGSNSWTVAANWDPQRVSPQPTDILQFTRGGTSTATNIPSQVVQQIIVDNSEIGLNSNTNVTFVSAGAGNSLDINGPAATDNLIIASGATLDLGGLTPTFNFRFQTTTTQQGSIAGTLIVRNGNSFLTSSITTGTGVQVLSGGSIRNIGTTANTGGTITSSALSLTFNDGATYSHERDGGAIPLATYYRLTPLIDNSTISVSGIAGTVLTGLSGNISNLEWNCPGQTVAQGVNGALNLFGNLTIDNTGTNVLQDAGQLIQGPGVASGRTFSIDNNGRFTMTNGTLTTGLRQAGSFPLFQNYSFSPTSTVSYNGNAVQPVQGGITYGNLSLGSNTKTANAALAVGGNLTIGGTTFNNGGFVIDVFGNVANNSGHTGTGGIKLSSGASAHVLSGVGAYTNLELDDSQGAVMSNSFTVSGSLALTSGTLALSSNTLTLNGTVNSATGLLSGISTSTLILSGTAGGNMGSIGFEPGGQTLNVLTMSRSGISPSVNITSPVSATTLNLTSGIINMATHTLRVTGTAPASITGGSATAYVSGKLARDLPTIVSDVTYPFPVGKTTYNQLRLINPTVSSSATVAVEVFDGAPVGGTLGFTLTGLGNRYWETEVTAGSLFTVGNIELSRTAPAVTATNVVARSATLSGQYATMEGSVVSATTIASVNQVDPSLGYYVIADREAICTPLTVTGDLVITGDMTLGNTIDVTGDFTVNSGVTVTVPQGCPLVVNATNIIINGVINANGAGRSGGNGGSGGNAYANCGNDNDNSYSGGLGAGGGAAPGGLGAGGVGTNGTNGNGRSRKCGGFLCSGNSDGHFGGGGGGGGGKGGSYGGAGGTGGGGAAGAFFNNGDNPSQSSGGAGGTTGAAQGTDTGTEIDMGFGGGGAGGGGGSRFTGGTGGSGGAGGGSVSLIASNALTVAGAINANGSNGGNGGNGSNNSSNNNNCSTGACGDCSVCSDATYVATGGAGGGAGGGSGGGIKLQAFGNMTLTGALNARGGNGGNAGTPNTSNGSCHSNARGGAGGGGGRIKVILNPCATNNVSPTASVSEGNGGGGNLLGNPGTGGVYVNNIDHPAFVPLLAGDVLTADQEYCASDVNLTTIDADPSTGGMGTASYQWYATSTACGNPTAGNTATPNAGWTSISGATAEDLTAIQVQAGITALGGGNGTFCFQRRSQSGICHEWTVASAVVIGTDPVVDTHPVVLTTVNSGDTPPTLTVSASGGIGAFSYQWFSNTVNNNTGGTNLGVANGAQTSTLTIPTDMGSDLYYYCVVSQTVTGCGPITSNTGRVTVIELANTWTGNLSTAWNNPGNWSQNVVPTIVANAIIPTTPVGGNFPTVNIIGAEVADMEVRTGAIVNIGTGNALTVSGLLDSEGTFNVSNGGSLVQTSSSTLTGSGTYNVTRNGSSVYDYWSSPITNASPGFLSSTVYQFDPSLGTADPSDDAFDPGWVAPGGTMVPGKGYAAYGAGTKTFTGTVNNDDVPIAVGSFAAPNVSYNLVGNPYPSGVSVNSFLTENSGILAVGAIYLWDDPGTNIYVTGDYAVRNSLSGTAGGGGNSPTGTIGTAQGFKVEVNGAGDVLFNNAMRTAGNTPNIFKQVETKLLWLSARSSGNRFNQTLVGFADDGTDGNDWAYDAPKLNALGELSLYSYMDGEPFAIQGYGPFDAQRVVPLGMNSGHQTTVTIGLDSTENMTVEDIILEDRHLGIYTDLRTAPYVCSLTAMTYDDRFFLHFAPMMVTGAGETGAGLKLNAYVANEMLHVRATGEFSGVLRMYDMSGKEVLQAPVALFAGSVVTMDVSHLAKGVYTVMVQNEERNHVSKVMR
jgi:hypothetical protein